MLSDDIQANGGSVKAVEAELMDRCAAGELKGKGRGAGGFHDIPENDWLGAHFIAKQPDTILCAGGDGRGWTHVRFLRDDVLGLWPAPDPELVAVQPVEAQTNKRQPWYPLLRTLMEAENKRLEEWPERKPGHHPPSFPTAAEWRRRLIARKFDAPPPAPSTVRYHVANIRALLGR